MSNYLLTARSLTYAQKSVRILTRSGITAVLLRTPKEIAANSCGYSVKVSEKYLQRSINTLKNGALTPLAVYMIKDDGTFEKVTL